ncbi:hypothetical protein [Thermoanaerobacterium thermosaccharolyticum]|uniref:hypothetical protein n=1 Tax=Thermoanaerobacterium thermosaccharolyticum TaxID=1517 RepID=UPI002FDA373A
MKKRTVTPEQVPHTFKELHKYCTIDMIFELFGYNANVITLVYWIILALLVGMKLLYLKN